MKRRILIIGGVAAGPSAASKAVRTNPDAEVVLLEQGDAISYGVCELPYHVSGEVNAEDLVVYTPESLRKEKGVDVRCRTRVDRILPGRKRLVVRDLDADVTREEIYDRLIIATGSTPRKLGMEHESAPNVFAVKTLADGLGIRKYVDTRRPTTVVIIGAGYIGVEMAEAFVARGVQVVMVENSRLPLPGCPGKARLAARESLEKHGVRFYGEEEVARLAAGQDGCVQAVLTGHHTFPADIVVVAIGVDPRTELARQARISLGPQGGILTDRFTRTSLDSVYAAGDCCEVRNLVTGRWLYAPLATTASRMGWVAGENAAGGRAVFEGALHASAVRVFDLELVRVGLSMEEASACGIQAVEETIVARSRVAMMPGSSPLTVTLLADQSSGRLLGGCLFGREGAVLRGHSLAVAVQQQLTVEQLRRVDFAYAPPFSPLWDPLLVAANALARRLSLPSHKR